MIDKSVRISDIAKKAGVSSATVSRYFNHPRLLQESTRAAIAYALKELGVERKEPAATQKSSGKARCRSILVNVPLFNSYYDEVIRGISTSAGMRGYHVLLFPELTRKTETEELLEQVETTGAAGVVTSSFLTKEDVKRITERTPMVMCAEFFDNPYCSCVGIDNRAAAVQATEHLISLGRRRIALLTTGMDQHWPMPRQEGFRSAMKKAGLPVEKKWIIPIPTIQYEAAYAAVTRFLSSTEVPDAIFAVSDYYAIAALNVARELGFRVPEDIAIVGFDGISATTMTYPALTTVDQPRYQIGYTAGELLLEHIANPLEPPRTIIFDTTLLVRGSTAS